MTGVALARPLRRRALIRLNLAHAWLYAHSGGRLGTRLGRFPVLLLTTVGRRTGRPRRTPVQFERIDGDLVIVAAGGGAPAPPAWWRNIEADPHVVVQVGRKRWRAVARPAEGADRARLWQELCKRVPRLAAAERRSGRELAVIRLVPDRPD